MKTKKDSKQIVGYVRSAVEDDLSVMRQEKQIKDCCLKNGWKLTKIFVDNGHSGANIQRPALKELLAEVKAGKIQQIVILDADRLSRNLKNKTTLKKLMEKHEVDVREVIGITAEGNDRFIGDLLRDLNIWQSKVRQIQQRRKRLGK